MKFIKGGVCAPKGFLAGGIACGIKKTAKTDLALIVSKQPAIAAGVVTTNKVKAAPILLSQRHLENQTVRAIVANSGNANACVGPQGDRDAEAMVEAAAKYLGIAKEEVLVASTGVIGVRLPVEKIETTLSNTTEFLSETGSLAAAEAIMTTDTFSKEVAVEFEINGIPVRIGGIAKGSGMIHPNMATMLGFITTDADIDSKMLQQAVSRAGEISFNRVTVDGDMSTNDCLFILANGQAGNSIINGFGPKYDLFSKALETVCVELAKMLAKDGEGATKFVEIIVAGGRSEAEAVQVGKSIATSSLVKTAIFGEDANWGRILAAAGYSGVDIEPEKVNIFLGDLLVCQNGTGLVFDEVQAKGILQQKDLLIKVDLGQGNSEATVWTCDFSYDYVKINGSYRT